MVFRKKLRSLERRWEKISKFLGDLPSEQYIFPSPEGLGAPESYRKLNRKNTIRAMSKMSARIIC